MGSRGKRHDERAVELKRRLKDAGFCTRCKKPNDRTAFMTKSGRKPWICSACLARAKSEQERKRDRSRALIEDMERALGMPVTGRGGRDLPK